MTIINFYKESKLANTFFLFYFFRVAYSLLRGRNIRFHRKVRIIGLNNISTGGKLKIGLDYVGFMNNADYTFLNIQGKLIVDGNYSIGKGCRFDIAKNAIVKIGNGGYINALNKLIIMHGLTIGNNCAIAWNCQFLDEDFHKIDYQAERVYKDKKITIGDHVWIGCNSSIYKGVTIPNGCVIAANSVVISSFNEENVLIGGNPAQIIKRNITWA